uniref:Glycosyltransferase family 92 protein n=1 Tax=Caenorhabditis tropicalis TaxID=1561998 RepID=A0A1I7TW13_9PELO
MLFLKYNETTETLWFNLKGVIRPESVFILFYHWSHRQVDNAHVMSVPKRVAHVRHYRQVENEGLNADQWSNYNTNLTSETRLDPVFEKKLIDNVVSTVKYVYEQRWVRCEEIPEGILQRFGRTLMDCLFKNETISVNSEK